MSDQFKHPEYLIETQTLAEQLGDPRLRILDCTTNLVPEPVPARDEFLKGHIPGAGFVDIQADLSDPDSPYRFMLPKQEAFLRKAEQFGIGDDSRVVLYSTGAPWWATRVWLVLRHFGFDNAAVLNGGWQKWVSEGRPIEEGDGQAGTPGRLTPRTTRSLFVGKEIVRDAIGDAGVCTLNALPPPVHSGAQNPGFNRAGHIAGSINVPAAHLIDPATNTFFPASRLRQVFDAAGVLERPRVIAYCGGGIAATADAFALTLLGHPDVVVYDASLNEWAADESLPMQTN